MKVTDNFFNQLATNIRKTYFANEIHGYTNNKQYWNATAVMEQFNNGCLTYKQLITKLAKNCNETKQNIHSIVKNYIVDFEGYKYQII